MPRQLIRPTRSWSCWITWACRRWTWWGYRLGRLRRCSWRCATRERVGHLVIMCGSFPGSPLTQAPPGWVKPLYSEPSMWLLSVLARPLLSRMVGVPEGFPRDAEQAAWVDWMLQSLFPVRPRFAGTMVDLYRTVPGINDYPLEKLTVPTLIVHAVDDPVASYDAAAAAADRIPGARLLTLDSGGHLMLGQTERTTSAVTAFRGEPSTHQQA